MAVTEKGVVREVNEVLSGFRIKRETGQIELSPRCTYLAQYAGLVLQGAVENPVRRGAVIGIRMLDTASSFAARHTQVDVRPMYKLATQDRSRKIRAFRPIVPDSASVQAQQLSFAPEVVVEMLANHGLWLASQDAARRKDIPDLLEKRLATSAKNPQFHLQVAVTAAVDIASGVAASIRTFESENGISERGSNVAGYAIYGYDFGDYDRLSLVEDAATIGRI
jgi:hypothetical protein